MVFRGSLISLGILSIKLGLQIACVLAIIPQKWKIYVWEPRKTYCAGISCTCEPRFARAKLRVSAQYLRRSLRFFEVPNCAGISCTCEPHFARAKLRVSAQYLRRSLRFFEVPYCAGISCTCVSWHKICAARYDFSKSPFAR